MTRQISWFLLLYTFTAVAVLQSTTTYNASEPAPKIIEKENPQPVNFYDMNSDNPTEHTQ